MTSPTHYTTTAGDELSRATFISQFVASACAGWTMWHVDEYCATNRHKDLEEPPLEDILFLADAQWTHMTTVLKP